MNISNEVSSKKLQAGMILVPKPKHLELLRPRLKELEHIVKQEEIDDGGTIGEMWMIKQ